MLHCVYGVAYYGTERLNKGKRIIFKAQKNRPVVVLCYGFLLPYRQFISSELSVETKPLFNLEPQTPQHQAPGPTSLRKGFLTFIFETYPISHHWCVIPKQFSGKVWDEIKSLFIQRGRLKIVEKWQPGGVYSCSNWKKHISVDVKQPNINQEWPWTKYFMSRVINDSQMKPWIMVIQRETTTGKRSIFGAFLSNFFTLVSLLSNKVKEKLNQTTGLNGKQPPGSVSMRKGFDMTGVESSFWSTEDWL